MFYPTAKRGIFVNNDGFVINFNCLIRAYNLSGSFVIEHWNKPARLWGYYCSNVEKYFLLKSDQLYQPIYKPGTRISIPYDEIIKPTDAIVFTNTVIYWKDGQLLLAGILSATDKVTELLPTTDKTDK